MAQHSANAVSWFLTVPGGRKDLLGGIRHWPGLKLAQTDEAVWVTGFREEQIRSVAVQAIPYKTVYYGRDERLFRQGSQLPEGRVPALLWTPLDRCLPVELPPFRGNYTTPLPPVTVQLRLADGFREPGAMLVALADLGTYVDSAPAVRLQPLRWVLLDNDRALVTGTPLLPVPGAVFWQQGSNWLPVGYAFDSSPVADLIGPALNPDGHDWLVWQADATFFRVPKDTLQPLTIHSFRLSKAP